MIPVVKNQEYELEITDITSEGQGIGRVDGFAVFVPKTAPGDRVQVRIVKVKSGYAFGIVTKILTSSPQRCTPACPHAATCGGCQLMHITYPAQLAMKKKTIQDALERIGGIRTDVKTVIGMETPFRYRNKMVFPIGKDKSGKIVCGFYRERSHDIVPLTDCLLGDASNQDILQAVLCYMQENGVSPYDEISHTGVVRRVFTRRSRATGEWMAVVSVNAKTLPNTKRLVELIRAAVPNVTSVILNHNCKRTNLVLGAENTILFGKDAIEDKLCGLWFSISPHSFFQVNPLQTEKLYQTAMDLANLQGGETVLDLYCGIGTISLLAAKQAKHVIGVEIVPQAIENARENAKRNNIENVEFYAADAQALVPRLIGDGIQPDAVILDPPRKGCDADTLSAIVASGAKKVVYVSCNPATLARDVRVLAEAGYTAETVVGVDLFPWTHHVETVVSLLKN